MSKIAGIVLCAGRGVRMNSERSKMLHEIAGVPICVWPVEVLSTVAQSENIVAVVGFQAKQVQEAIAARFPRTNFAVQSEQKGTGDAVKIGISQIPKSAETILVIGGDTPLLTKESLNQLLKSQKDSGAKVAMFVTEQDKPFGYGRIVRDIDGQVSCIVEEKDATIEQRKIAEVNSGIYAFDGDFLRQEILHVTNANAQGEFYLTDLIQRARELFGSKAIVTQMISKEEAAGVNDRIQLSECEYAMRQRINQGWMRHGVTMVDPSATYIDAKVILRTDVTLHAGVTLQGTTRIERNVIIGEGCVVTDSLIGEGAHLHPYSVIEGAMVGKNANVGPFARLRAGSVLEEATRVGNFVEMKKTTLKRGSKANHLAYLGDATIGENCNIGAGTITCNYDGYKKYQTIIGDGSFIGSNSTLVAPVVIGEQSYVGAGSTVTKDVPSDALALSRARQENKLGYASSMREKLKTKK